MKATATLLSTMLTILAACVPLAHGQYGGAPAAPGYGPPGPGMGAAPGMPGPYGAQPYMASPYAPSGAGYPPAGGLAPPPSGYSPQQALMQMGYANAGYYQDDEEPSVLLNGQPPQGYVPDDYSGFEVYGDTGQFDDMSQSGEMGVPYAGNMAGGAGGGNDPYDVRRHRFWFQSESLIWTRHKRAIPPLVASSVPGTPRNAGPAFPIAATLGQPNTTLMFGGNREGEDATFGAAIDFGFWLDPPNEIGIGGRFWILDDDEQNYSVSSATPPLGILGVPIFNAVLGKEDALLVGFLGGMGVQQAGQINVHMSNEIHGADAYMRLNMLHWFGERRGWFHNWDMLMGYQYTQVNDLLTLRLDTTTSTPATFVFLDHFRAKNQFHGGLVGLSKSFRSGRFSMKATGKVGVGNMHQSVLVAGFNTVDVGGGPLMSPGGLFTQPSNLGKYTRDHFAYIPQFKVDFGYQMTNIFRATVGYEFIYWSNVMLAGQQMDRVINTNFLGGGGPGAAPVRPEFWYRDIDFWAMGLNFSLIGEF